MRRRRKWLLVEQPECKHTPAPKGYTSWHAWAEKQMTTHRQERCPVCGLWAMWKRKKRQPKETQP